MQTPLYCRKCGSRISAESAFCSVCGASQNINIHASTSLPYQEPSNVGTGRLPAGRMLHQRYRLLQAVGQGGMGAVYVAQDTQLGDRLVAVKEMSMSRLAPQELPQAVEQFKREAHLLASLHHPNLPVIHDYFGERERWYLVMSFIEGSTVQSALDAAPGNKLPVNEVVRIGIELCNVLDYLHMHQPQIVFRDLKPLNIMRTPKGAIFLIDFGIARHFKQDQMKDTAYYYSAGYAPPEQYGQSQTGPRSDLYSLGATLHQMLSGHHPTRKPFQFADLQLIDPTIPVPLAKLIAQLLEMNELARPASASEVKERLEKILQPDPLPATQQALPAKKEQAEIEKEQKKPVDVPVVGDKKGFWNRINLFSRTAWMVVWVCLIGFALALGLVTGITLLNQFGHDKSNMLGMIPLLAGIGSVFLARRSVVTRKRTGLNGILIIILGFATFIAIGAHNVLEHDPQLYIPALLILGNFLFFAGSALFMSRARRVNGLIFGFCLALVGVVSIITPTFPQGILIEIVALIVIITAIRKGRTRVK